MNCPVAKSIKDVGPPISHPRITPHSIDILHRSQPNRLPNAHRLRTSNDVREFIDNFDSNGSAAAQPITLIMDTDSKTAFQFDNADQDIPRA